MKCSASKAASLAPSMLIQLCLLDLTGLLGDGLFQQTMDVTVLALVVALCSQCDEQTLKVRVQLQDAGFQQAFDPIRVKFKPTAKDMQVAEESGTGGIPASCAVRKHCSFLLSAMDPSLKVDWQLSKLQRLHGADLLHT